MPIMANGSAKMECSNLIISRYTRRAPNPLATVAMLLECTSGKERGERREDDNGFYEICSAAAIPSRVRFGTKWLIASVAPINKWESPPVATTVAQFAHSV